MGYITWALSPSEKALAIAEGKRRQAVNVAQGKLGRNNGPAHGENALRMHILGAGGEMAVASYLGLKDGVFEEVEANRGSSDLPFDIDVKTRSRHYYDLICLLDEREDKTLVLVTVENREIRLHGWIRASEAKQAQWKKEYVANRPCYFVPKENLRSMEELKECLAAQTLPSTLFD
ncbi:hypothetical protein S-CBS4_gp011 [Synechococcus phage S-CBS4]|uniref:hypothetical protein n=1 Tax=Synechococcus phage S-CBS4 TaxID=756275 RepID=UPI000246A6E3|nr:hypothetical protein S-CBS4_gp011 [Synechococcus phage S-CBS4]AEX55978.1 hypothetical protein S-CBS4_gp011 [Synechococcus phage S-CBS4]AGN30543.1 hypothetical protein SXAG_00096 [Synechococcus phage S-CBS4]